MTRRGRAFPAAIDLDSAMIDRAVKLANRLQGDEPIDPAAVGAAWTNRYVAAARQ